MGAFGNELDRADVSAYKKLYDRANYHQVMSSQYSIHHQIVLVIHACEKNVSSLPSLSPWTRFAKWKAVIMGRHGTHGSFGEKR